jgi:hypothetical protein
MDPFTMAHRLLGDERLTPGQLAELRALNTRYFSRLAALSGGGREAGAGDMAALHASIAADIRLMLTPEQRTTFDRNVPALADILTPPPSREHQ